MRSVKNLWTDEMDYFLHELSFVEGLPASEVARDITAEFKLYPPLTRSAILGRIHRKRKAKVNG